MLKAGEKAPEFVLENDKGEETSLTDLLKDGFSDPPDQNRIVAHLRYDHQYREILYDLYPLVYNRMYRFYFERLVHESHE